MWWNEIHEIYSNSLGKMDSVLSNPLSSTQRLWANMEPLLHDDANNNMFDGIELPYQATEEDIYFLEMTCPIFPWKNIPGSKIEFMIEQRALYMMNNAFKKTCQQEHIIDHTHEGADDKFNLVMETCMLTPCLSSVCTSEAFTCSNTQCMSCRVCSAHLKMASGVDYLWIHCNQMRKDDENFLLFEKEFNLN